MGWGLTLSVSCPTCVSAGMGLVASEGEAGCRGGFQHYQSVRDVSGFHKRADFLRHTPIFCWDKSKLAFNIPTVNASLCIFKSLVTCFQAMQLTRN